MKKQNEQHNQKRNIWQRFAASVHNTAQQFADTLSERYEKLSQAGKTVSLLLFGVAMGAASLYFIFSPGQAANTLAEATAKLPVVIPGQPSEPLITLQEYQQLMSFRQALDSLHTVNPVLYDQLLHERQGLLDSLNLLINLYRKQ